ncbi:superoxide dismutase, Ni [Veronia pacifica]
MSLKRLLPLGILLSSVSFNAFSHCQIPCGIYDDHAEVKSMLLDATTIKKATTMIASLSVKNDAQSKNQLTRWVVNKENHAQSVIDSISDYFLTQRVKPSSKDYTERLVRHHAVIVAAMKAKQNADGKFADELSKAINALSTYYPEHKH